jgi:hypothetical protein
MQMLLTYSYHILYSSYIHVDSLKSSILRHSLILEALHFTSPKQHLRIQNGLGLRPCSTHSWFWDDATFVTPPTVDIMAIVVSTSESTDNVGYSAPPSIGEVRCSNKYLHETMIRRLRRGLGTDPAQEDIARIQGVQLIDDVRNALQLSVHRVLSAMFLCWPAR